MKPFNIVIFLIFNVICRPALCATQTDVVNALQGIERINGFAANPEVSEIIPRFYTLPAQPAPEIVRDLFEKLHLLQWSTTLADFLGLSAVIFEGLPADQQVRLREEYEAYKQILVSFQYEITEYIRRIHPGYSALGIKPLQDKSTGQGVRIAVFDLFDPALLKKQQQYHNAYIEPAVVFGNPIEMSHGNTVIDIILQLAPDAVIVPVAADAKSYVAAMQFITAHDDFDLINMSRAFPIDSASKSIDASFKKTLRTYTKKGILVKSLGNTGSDLWGTLNRRRVEKNLGPVNTFSGYDLKLIRDLYEDTENAGMELFAINLTVFSDDIALTASIPGSFIPVQQRCLAAPAEGIHSPSSGTFESGSSFAAPQIAAWLALLLEKRRQTHPKEDAVAARQAVYSLILKSANAKGHSAEEWGRGMPSAASGFDD